MLTQTLPLAFVVLLSASGRSSCRRGRWSSFGSPTSATLRSWPSTHHRCRPSRSSQVSHASRNPVFPLPFECHRVGLTRRCLPLVNRRTSSPPAAESSPRRPVPHLSICRRAGGSRGVGRAAGNGLSDGVREEEAAEGRERRREDRGRTGRERLRSTTGEAGLVSACYVMMMLFHLPCGPAEHVKEVTREKPMFGSEDASRRWSVASRWPTCRSRPGRGSATDVDLVPTSVSPLPMLKRRTGDSNSLGGGFDGALLGRGAFKVPSFVNKRESVLPPRKVSSHPLLPSLHIESKLAHTLLRLALSTTRVFYTPCLRVLTIDRVWFHVVSCRRPRSRTGRRARRTTRTTTSQRRRSSSTRNKR